MKIIRVVACLSFLSVVAACAPAGYYDSNGEYRSYGKSDSFRHDTTMSGTPQARVHDDDMIDEPVTTTVIYDRRGFYDGGGYVDTQSGPVVPGRMFPPRGECRIWFDGRPASEQPAVQSCDGIQDQVPDGAYIIYGG